jgi:hypothetical protein
MADLSAAMPQAPTANISVLNQNMGVQMIHSVNPDYAADAHRQAAI